MIGRALPAKILAGFLAFLIVLITAPFSPAEALARAPIGAVVTAGTVSIGSVTVPTGTTVFSGDRVAASSSPALINFISGSRVEINKAAAVFSRSGNMLMIQADQGLLRFHFREGEDVQINAGKYVFSAVGGATPHTGELGLGRNGQIAMSTAKGAFAVLNTATGERSEVDASSPLVMLDQGGQGAITKNAKLLTDSSKSWQPDELKGKCVVAGDEAHQIEGNSSNTLTIKGAWKLNTGTVDYKIVDCTKDALFAAGASAAAAGAVATGAGTASAAATGAAVGTAAGMSGATVAAIVAGVGAAVTGIVVGVYEATKSSSSR